MTMARVFRIATALMVVIASMSVAPGRASAQAIPEPARLPQQLSLDDSLKILRTRGIDLLIAEAQVHSAEGDVRIAGAVPNPAVALTYGRVFTYSTSASPNDPSSSCSAGGNNAFCDLNQYTANVSDQAAIEDSLSGKRSLRLKVANAALAAAKLSRTDALRNLEFQVKSAYLQVAQAQRSLEFAKEAQATNVRTFELFQARLRSGAINEGEMARVETQKLESDQAVDQAAEARPAGARMRSRSCSAFAAPCPSSPSTTTCSTFAFPRRSRACPVAGCCARRSSTGPTSWPSATRGRAPRPRSLWRSASGSRTSRWPSGTRRREREATG